ncbi:MAG: hypothetical protein SX243_11530 [Acidobacteriota bacterium]|nr:hypothetical protein [Acidobacteriota bacterium]
MQKNSTLRKLPQLFGLGLLALAVSLALGSSPAFAASFPCSPCAGVVVDDPTQVLSSLEAEPRLDEEARFFVAWPVSLDGEEGSVDSARAAFGPLRQAGAQPWVQAIFRTPQPVGEHLDRLEAELQQLAALVKGEVQGEAQPLYVQAVWRPEGIAAEEVTARDLAFLIKRAAVAVTGAAPEASFVAGPLNTDEAFLNELYGQEVAAYLDVVAIEPGEGVAAAALTLAQLDPGKPVAVDALSWPAPAEAALARAAEAKVAGASVALFELPAVEADSSSSDLGPLKVLAREFQGDLSYSEYGSPSGAAGGWAFVRGEDLALRVIVEKPAGSESVDLLFGDDQLRRPSRVDLATGEEEALFGQRRTADGLLLTIDDPAPVAVLRLERATAEELEGVAERLEVEDERQMPVEEILRRLQAFEDAQARRLDHYQATNTLHLRFQVSQGSLEASYAGEFFFRRDEGFDWVWDEFYIDGVRWKSKQLPELPLIQPEKAASMPVDIKLSKDYSYRLRGTATVDGRDCWVVDFRPLTVEPGRSLFQGTVWVDREIYSRVRTRAVQVGLEGDVLSNEETVYFSPVDAAGEPAPWSRESFVLPLRTVGQQTLSLLSATVPVERETVLTNLALNGESFEQNLESARASDSTMVRDTDAGLRYLRKDEDGDRVVEEEQETGRLFVLGGVLWDESLDFPLPLAGVNYLDLDFRDSGNQVNVFFAGAFLAANYSDPSLFGSRWNGGLNVNGFFIQTGDELYRDGREVPEEEVESTNAAVSFFLGRPLTNFLTLDLTYSLGQRSYSRADDTADGFVLPQDTLTHTAQAELTYARSGYRLYFNGSFNQRSDWEFWGLPGNAEFDPEQEDYVRWRVELGKTWWFSKFRNFSLSLEHLNGSDLDRFSSYDFGLFGDSSVGGYQSGLVRAEEASGVHFEYGINAFELLRVEVDGDAVWASNEATGLEDELLAGIGLGGTVTLPWNTVMNFEVGTALEGPGEGDVAARIVFLKLFPSNGKKRWWN